MSSKNEGVHTIKTDFIDSGVVTSQARSKIREQDMWECRNGFSDFRGALRKRPRTFPIGSLILEPTRAKSDLFQFVSMSLPMRKDTWMLDTALGDGIGINITSHGTLAAYGIPGIALPTTGQWKFVRPVLGGEAYNDHVSYDDAFTYGFSFKTTELYPKVMSTDDEPGISVMFAVKENEGTLLHITRDGWWIKGDNASFYYSADWAEGVDPLDGERHTLKLTHSPSENGDILTVYMDETVVGLCAAYSLAIKRPTNGNWVEVNAYNNNTMTNAENFSINMWGFYVRDAYEAVSPGIVRAITSKKQYTDETSVTAYKTYLGTSQYVWQDTDFLGMLDPIFPTVYENIRFSNFKDSVIVSDYGTGHNTVLYEITGSYTSRVLDDAPNVRFCSEYKGRLWAGGDSRFPSRVYFSGDRHPNEWFSPETDADGQETVDEVLDAGYIAIPTKDGERVTALYGGMYDSLIIFTDRACYRVTGSEPSNDRGDGFRLETISESVAAFSPECVVRVGNELWTASEHGIASIESTNKFGDLLTEKTSFAVQDIFSDSGFEYRRLDTQKVDRCSLVYQRSSNTVMFGYPRIGDREATELMVFNTYLNKWYGPWDVEHTSIATITTDYPLKQSVAYGTSLGEILYFGAFEDPDSELKILSPIITGRSIDPRFEVMTKTWGNMRLIINPTGLFDITVRWKVEGEPFKQKTYKLSSNSSSHIGDLFTVQQSSIGSREDIQLINVPLDVRGRGLKYEITSSAPSVALLGMEIDFTPDGIEKE
jgi:hypothetical protein